MKVIPKHNCCGCGACAQRCPKNCITMAADEEGFLYPQVDEKTCVHCGICHQTCPILNPMPAKEELPRVYAACALDESIRAGSSSGGVFSLLAQWVLEQGGTVFGAAFDDDFSVHHIKIEHPHDLHMLRGSKYLQSRMENCHAKAKQLLEAGRVVLFSGVGCQIAGLKQFLGKEYDRLYTVDVLCHGVPSPLLWQQYLKEQEAVCGESVRGISFRSKTSGWKSYSVEHQFRDGSIYRKEFTEDRFMQCFLRDICLRPSCHSCAFRAGRSGADLTLGDAWGVDRWMPEMDDDRGTSVVLINGEKGRYLWQCIADQVRAKEGNAQEILRCNPVYWESVRPHPNRKRFFAALSRGESMAKLERLSRRTRIQRGFSFGKRIVKFILRKIGILKQ